MSMQEDAMVRMIALAGALLAGVLAISTAAAQQFPPHRFFGTVTIGGQPAPVGTTVRALIGGTECATATVTAGGGYVLDVPGVTINPNCGRSGQSTVTFQVDGQEAGTATYRDGGYQQLNLAVGGAAQPSPTPAPTGTPRPSPTPAPAGTPRPTATPAAATPAPTAAPTARPTTAPAATPRPQAPSAPAAAPAQRPAAAPAAAAPAAQRPAAAPAALPRTGTGGLQGDTDLTAGWMLAGGALAVFGLAGMALARTAVRRSRSH
jgi:hypothetical protein